MSGVCMFEHLSDEQLVQEYRKGAHVAFEVLVKRSLDIVYAITYRYTRDKIAAEDCTQEVFVKIWKYIKRFDEQRTFRAWISHIAKNTALDYLKKKKTLNFSDFENEEGENHFLESLIDPAPLPSAYVYQKDITQAVTRALEKISAPYRTVLFLYYKSQMNFREIAAELRESIDTIKSRHRRALIIVRKMFENDKKFGAPFEP